MFNKIILHLKLKSNLKFWSGYKENQHKNEIPQAERLVQQNFTFYHITITYYYESNTSIQDSMHVKEFIWVLWAHVTHPGSVRMSSVQSHN